MPGGLHVKDAGLETRERARGRVSGQSDRCVDRVRLSKRYRV